MDMDALTEFTQQSIRCSSPTGQERTFVELVCKEMQTLGYDRVWVDPAGSAVGEIRGCQPGKRLLLDGHADTVNANTSDWQYDPFAGIIDSGRLYGRGTADTKGNLAAMIHAAASIERHRIAGSIFVCASVHEENFEGGSLRVICEDIQPDLVIIGEATDLNLNYGGRGRAEIKVETIGKSAHSSSPQVGLCAVHAMLKLLQLLEQRPPKYDPDLGTSSLVLTDIISSPYPGHSVIPNRCFATFDMRLMLEDSPESVIEELFVISNDAGIKANIGLVSAQETTYTGHVLNGNKYFPAWVMHKNDPFIETSLSALRTLRPETLLGTFQFCTNGTYSAGIAHIPTLGYGLGKETDAHTVDESIALEHLYRGARGYRAIIEKVLAC